MKLIGLTGGIGSGKTTVARFFGQLGIPIFIADVQAREVLENSPEVHQKIIALLGERAIIDGKPDRKYISSQVFKNREKLDSLNAIIHPEVAKIFQKWQTQQHSPYVIYEAAILFETGGYQKMDFNILVTAPQEVKVKRLLKRDATSKSEIEARMANQWSDSKKLKFANFIIKNTNLKNTWEEVKEIHQILLKTE